MLAQCPQLAVRLHVFTESFNLVIRPAGSPCLATRGLGDALQGAEGVPFLAEDDEAFLNSVHEQGLAELESGNVAIQIGRIFRARRARLLVLEEAGTAEEPDRSDRCKGELPGLTYGRL